MSGASALDGVTRLRVTPRTRERRCAYCRDDVRARGLARCASCGLVAHQACARELPDGCPTPGCSGRWAGPERAVARALAATATRAIASLPRPQGDVWPLALLGGVCLAAVLMVVGPAGGLAPYWVLIAILWGWALVQSVRDDRERAEQQGRALEELLDECAALRRTDHRQERRRRRRERRRHRRRR